MKKTLFYLLLPFLLFCYNMTKAEIIEIEPLFEYCVAPEELVSLEERCNYLVTHFWEPLNPKSKEALNQTALNEAFRVYLTTVRYADEKTTLQSIDKLLSSISGNPTYLIQFANAAEETLYGPRAEIWSDEIYLKFLDAAIKNKKIPQGRKDKFQKRANLLRTSMHESQAPSFDFFNPDGIKESYFPMSTPTILIFGDPEDMDWRLQRLRMESNTNLSQALDKGKINIIFIDVAKKGDLKEAVSNYSRNWKTGKSDGIEEIYDIRVLPSFYVVDSTGKIVLKNKTMDESVGFALELSGW